jgi:hypothetical protein
LILFTIFAAKHDPSEAKFKCNIVNVYQLFTIKGNGGQIRQKSRFVTTDQKVPGSTPGGCTI